MKKISLIIVAISVSSISSAQFSMDFSTYTNGALSSSPDWGVFNSAGPDPFTVSGGQLIIDPADSWTGFSAASYNGSGGTFNSQFYKADIRFSLNFSNGTSSIRTGASVMPQFEIENTDFGGETVRFGIRHVAPFGGSPSDGNVFNIFVGDRLNGGGSDTGAFSAGFFGTEMGMTVDGSGLWTDGQSNDLILSYTLTGDGANNWDHELNLIDAGDSSIISTITLSSTDTDGSFSAITQRFRFFPANMQVEQAATHIDSISLSTVPEPSTFALLAGVCVLGFIAIRRRK